MNRVKQKSTPRTASDKTGEQVSEDEVSTPAQESAAGQPSAADGTDDAEELSKLRRELEASKDRSVRLMADFDNYRKRMNRERAEIVRRAGEDLVSSLLPVIDHFDLALQQAADASDPFVVGVRMVYDQLVSALGKEGLSRLDAVGVLFDPSIHEALAYQPSPEVAEGHVIIQTRCGYRLGDHLMRPVSVIVSSGAPQAPSPAGVPDAPPADGAEGEAAGMEDAAAETPWDAADASV